MGQIKKHYAVKLIIGFIFKEEGTFNTAQAILRRRFGKIDFESGTVSFTHTDYYENEFGKDLKRKFISFQKLIPSNALPRIKLITNKIEERLSSGLKRKINIDPGYLTLSKLILASTKDYRHRLYLGQGIFGEITLFYQGKTFKPWEWTYPDYKTQGYILIFNQIREIYAQAIKVN
jgi:hypothetical protein